jgi:tellurite resistance protein
VDAERSAVQLLQQKAPDEVEPYRQFVLDVATSVADAAKGTSAGESQVIERIRAALNPS